MATRKKTGEKREVRQPLNIDKLPSEFHQQDPAEALRRLDLEGDRDRLANVEGPLGQDDDER
jgi:hypothetical protein